MNTSKTSSYGRLVAFFIVAVTLVCVLGFVASGWQTDDPSNAPDAPVDENSPSQDAENGSADNAPGMPQEPEASPVYTNRITGLETSEAEAMRRPVAFVTDPTAPAYGIADAPLMIEVPTEGGRTRLITFSTDISTLGKIGSLCSARGYITNLIKYFSSVAIYYANDDVVEYSSCDHSELSFDLSANSGYHYTEYTEFMYTNGDLIKAGLNNSQIGTTVAEPFELPYEFSTADSRLEFDDPASSVTVAFSESEVVTLSYSSESCKYTMSRNGEIKKDLLTDKAVCFDNAFVLFADSVTYESADSTETVIQTLGSGIGYYLTSGTRMPIKWSADESGRMIFATENGSKIEINTGTSYISVVKSSMISSVTFL